MIENTVTMSVSDYDELKRKADEAEKIRREYEKDCEQRGYLVKRQMGYFKENLIDDVLRYQYGCEKIEIMRRDELLDPLLEQVCRWKDAFEAACRKNEKLEKQLDDLRHRNILRRIINR